MEQTQIIIWKGKVSGNFYYTKQIRYVYFLYSTKWKNVEPINQVSYNDAENLKQ